MKKLIIILILSCGFLVSESQTLRINLWLRDSSIGPGQRALFFDTTRLGDWKNISQQSGGGSGSGVASVTGTLNRIVITGTATNPIVNISTNYIGQNTITTLGTITTGVWTGTPIGNSFLANSSITIGSTAISLGATSTTLAGLTSVSSTSFTGALTGNATTATALATGRTISITGDLSYTSPSFDGSGNVTAAGTLATVNGNVGSFGSATQVGTFTVNGKGLITAASNVTITPAESSITFTDITTNNTSTTQHGFFPKLTSNTVYYVNNAGTLVALALGSSGQVLTSNGATSAPTFETPSGGGVAWNAITNPTGDQALTFDAGESSTWTNSNTTEDLMTWNSSTVTTSSMLSINSTSTAINTGYNLAEFVSSGSNANATRTATGVRIDVSNTGTTSTNVGLNVITSGATNNYAILAQGRVGISTPTAGAFSPEASLHIKDADAGVTSFQITDAGSSQYRLKIRDYGSVFENFSSNFVIYNASLSGTLSMGGYGSTNAIVLDDKRLFYNVRSAEKQGADVASSAGAITLGTGGNTFEITGTAAITLISSNDWQNGSKITLLFTSTATLTDGTANSGTDIGMELAGNTNFVGSAGATISLILSEIGGVQRWRETARSVQ